MFDAEIPEPFVNLARKNILAVPKGAGLLGDSDLVELIIDFISHPDFCSLSFQFVNPAIAAMNVSLTCPEYVLPNGSERL